MVWREVVKQSETDSSVARSAWQPMMLRWVGDVGSVTAKKSGSPHDSSQFVNNANKG